MDDFSSIYVMLGSMILGIACFGIIFAVIEIIARIKIFQKIGIDAWKAIIPFYSDYVFAEKVWDTKFIVLSWIVIATSIFSTYLTGIKFIGIIFRLLSMILPFVGLAIRFRFCQWTGRAFNKSNGFIIGMFILPIVFDTMLGFNADEYVDNMFLESDDEF